MMNILNGGAHADNSVDVQEFMVMPLGASSFHEALRWGVEVFHNLKAVLKKNGYSTAVGDEGGFAPNLKSNEEALEARPRSHHRRRLQARRADRHRARSGRQRVLRRATKKYISRSRTNPRAPPSRWRNSGQTGCAQYPIVSLEDGLAEDDWDGWKHHHPAARARKFSSWATTSSSPTRRFLRAASPKASPIRSSSS